MYALEQLRSDLDFRAVLENKCDLSVLVDDGFFNHHCPDGVVPVVHHFRLFLEGADIKRHFLVLLTAGSASARKTDDIDGGVKTYNSGEDSPKVIESTEIVNFECKFSLIATVSEEESELAGRIYTLNAERDNGTVRCKIDWYGRGSSSVPRELTADASFMKKLQAIVEKYDFAQHNGYVSVVSGLPHMYGAKLDIRYASGESIYAHDNQDCFITFDAIKELAELFNITDKE